MTDRRIYAAAALAMLAGKALALARRIAPDPEPEPEIEGWRDMGDALPMLDAGVVMVSVHGSTFWRYMGGESHWRA